MAPSCPEQGFGAGVPWQWVQLCARAQPRAVTWGTQSCLSLGSVPPAWGHLQIPAICYRGLTSHL